ncbi:uncharacterized protein RCC_02770 [Ramularia collo-cygni]|uniref:Bromo domain-containing protein n=1 Tax=Ramularia collo-cygni TaxID=112498 RepID=A0A2D3V085_9PEZI|nr:uncharacterized protein RCC_02770 [Ramularia collo-cygni]CZT16936.1 uncharacterized protein RCC_02770 [Ramularia collo-cygni]
MTSLASYSPLEELLLFQALRNDAAVSFSKISDDLKNIPLVRDDPSYDPDRLDPDALRQLYLGLLKEEVKQDLEQQTNGGRSHPPNGDVSPSSRKRKIASPSLPTVQEAAQHTHLIPQLVSRLYSRYRDNVAVKVREHEQRYASITRELAEIEAGEWDERLQQQEQARSSKQPSSTTLAQSNPARNVEPTSAPSSAAHTPNATPKPVEAPKRYSQATIDAVMNHGPEPQGSSSSHRRMSSNTSLPPLSEMAPRSPQLGIPPSIPIAATHQQMQPIAPHQYNQGPSHGGHQSPYGSSHAHPRQSSIPSPVIQQSLSRPSSSHGRILPPPHGMPLSTGSPVAHVGSPVLHQQHYAPQHRMQSATPPANEYSPRNYPPTLLPQQQAGYHTQQQYQDQRTSYPVQHNPLPQHPQQPQHQQPSTYPLPHVQPSRAGGYMLPPFQVAHPDHHKPIQPQPPRQHRTPVQPQQQPASYMPHAHGGPSTAPRGPPLRQSREVSDVLTALATPPRRRDKPLWKREYLPSPLQQIPVSTPRPDIEPLSPTQEHSKSPTRSSRSKRGRDVQAVDDAKSEPPSKIRTSKRRANARAGSPHSVVSSTADESLRSHSVLNADDRPASRNGVKAEPSTPGNLLEDTEPATVHSGASTNAPKTRKRRGTVNSQPQPASKRKRHESPGGTDDHEPVETPPRKSNTVIATRNFAKMSSALMNDINSHKHAAYFATAVREKAAPGYNDIVLRPQNLKSIRAAITAGTKAVAAASSALDSPAEGSSARALEGLNTIELERTADLEPPKAIVNGAQLEKELMRMLANAYMFNPGEDGMALSTREFFHDIEEKISDWRATMEDDDSKGKRRKM